MANPYLSPSLANYNANPPPDDGSATDANEITWAGIRAKLTDPLVSYAAGINAAALSFGATYDAVTAGRLIQTQSFSGVSTVTFTGITSAYDEYEFVLSNISFGSPSTALLAQISQDGGSTFKNSASDYKFSIHTTDASGGHTVTS